MTDPISHARSFGSAAERYDRYRPSYAPEAVTWALGERPVRVVDLGAGTGILSRLLHRLGHEVIAVEPDDLMREHLLQASPGVMAYAGSAERIPLPDGSVDAVVAGQAYHWFDPDRAHPEIARVLRPGGVLAAFWNDADLGTPWTVRYVEIIDGGGEAARERPLSDFGPLFGPVEAGEFPHDMWMTPDDLVAMATTRSPYLVGTEHERAELVGAVRELLVESELGGHSRFPMPHLTRVHRAARLA
ncbi:class I SAM-dependent methyltransferase [Catellatospora tritici]|uniref:class I SAM-dependent methyltransferase n=1 Tax=Catellatospora tritici TaxID=2851566 RepID=UPI001C2CDE6C|nr:class I SAM-dependent methyltransferase [Catellatospora tritici]MBV1849587.1 class I SAM-dependent methyltransferase [Catellatospora tritici]